MSIDREDAARELAALREEVALLRGEVRLLADRAQIYDCVHRYSRGLDRRDWEIFASAYHEDARDQHGEFVGAPAELVSYVSDVMKEWDFSLHILDLNNVEVDGDFADSECYVLFTQRRRDGEGLDFGGGRYLDRLERRNGEWRIVARQVVIDWTARTEALTFADVPEYALGTLDRNDPSYRRPFEVARR